MEKKFPEILNNIQNEWAEGNPVLVMFQDEARFGRISANRYCWCPKPFRPVCPTMVTQEYTYAYGAVNVATGKFDSLVLPKCDTDCMQIFLNEIAERYEQEKIVMVLDGAGWHKAVSLKIPKNIYLVPLPAYSPELNPVEHIWDELREKGFHNKVFSSLNVLEDHLVNELKQLENSSETVRSIVAWPWIIKALLI